MRTISWIVIGSGLVIAALAPFHSPPRVTGHVFSGGGPILREMHAAHDGAWSDDSVPARRALLEHFPIGTERDDIIRALSRERFECQNQHSGVRAVPGDLARAKADYIDCQLQVARGFGSRRWIVDLWFDANNRLLGARVAAWNIFF